MFYSVITLKERNTVIISNWCEIFDYAINTMIYFEEISTKMLSIPETGIDI